MSNGNNDCQALLEQEIRPGDLITAELFNCIRKKVASIEGKAPSDSGGRSVPNLFGLTLAQARSLLKQPTVSLKLGKVLDALGKSADPNAADSQMRVVIGHFPGAGTRVATGSKVDILIAATAVAGGEEGEGEEAATGFINVEYKSSPRGTNIVVGDDDGFAQIFEIINSTNKELTIQLSAVAIAPSGDWSGAVDVQDIDTGETTGSVKVAAQSGSVPGTEQVQVVVTAPDDAVEDDEVTLTVTANAPAPHNKTGADSVTLLVSDEEGDPVVRAIKFEQFQAPTDTDDVNTSQIFTFTSDFKYTAEEEPLSATFDVIIEVDATPPETFSQWGVLFNPGPTNHPQNTNIYRKSITLNAEATAATRVIAQMQAPSQRSNAADKVAKVTVRIESTDLDDQISAETPELTFTLKQLAL